MSFTDDFLKGLEKRGVSTNSSSGSKGSKNSSKTVSGANSFTNDFLNGMQKRNVQSTTSNNFAPIRTITTTKKKKKKDEDERKWFNSGLFEDGYDLGDITKTILGSGTDLVEDIGTGIIGMGEKAWDGLLMLGSAMNGQQMQQAAQNEMMFNAVTGKDTEHVLENYQNAQKQVEKETAEYVAKDLYDEEKIAKKIITQPVEKFASINVEDTSVFGAKSDSLIQSGGQLLGTAGLQMVGVPWFVTTGATAYGSQAEQALKEGATFNEANASALISAGAEILTEKLSGGIKFGGKTLDDVLLKPLTERITSKTLKTLTNLGLDAVGEGSEEVVSSVLSNLGTALYKEDKVSDILFSEEAVDEYIESFIGGSVLGGVSSGFRAVRDGVEETYTDNEQKVIDKEIENRIAEIEQDGNKLTKKEKSKIREDVLSDLDKGAISIDTIESVLGGETYDNYKSTVEREDSLLKEFEELGNKTNATLKEQTRYKELADLVEEYKSNSQRSQLKSQLSDEVFNLAKDSRLAESYNEKTRKSQYYETDLNQYDEKQRAIVQKAIDSKVLNNTNRTHDFVDMVSKLSAEKGVLFDFTNNEKLKESGFAVEGKTVNGFVNENGDIVLNMDSHKAHRSVVGHEITHILEGTELYTELQEMVKQYATTKGEYVDRMQSLRELYTDVYKGKDFDEKIQRELTADIVGDYLFTDEQFINSLSTEKPNLFKRIYNEIKYLYKVATAGSKEARELEKVKRAFDKAYKESGKAQGNTKYSLSNKNAWNNIKNIQGLEGYSVDEVVNMTKDHINNILSENGEQVEIVAISPYGSRARGTANNKSDLDIVVQYEGDIREDDMFNMLNDEEVKLYFDDIEVDINPIKAEDSGSIEEYLSRVYDYDKHNAKYSLSDSDGKQLTKEQQEYFKDSKVRDENGYLKPVYHTTNNDFTVFDKSRKGEATQDSNTYLGFFFSDDAEYLQNFPQFENGKTEAYYLNIANPIDMTDISREAFLDIVEVLGGDVDTAIDVYEEAKLENSDNPAHLIYLLQDMGADTNYSEFIEELKPHYDELMSKGYDGVINYLSEYRGIKEYIVLDSNQAKLTSNTNPTKNADIRYSLSDSEGRKLSKEQQDYFRNAKTVDEEGRLKPFYHGTGRADRVGTIFDPNRATSGPMAYFTDSKEIADNYARDKNDTSIAYDSEYDSYETQFRVERNGKNMSVVDLWYKLPLSERNAIYEKAKHITMDDNWENVIYSEETQYGLGNFDKYELNRHKGNVLHTLVDSWLTDGNIYGEEHKFLDVLKLVGIEDAKYMNPDFRDEKTYQVYLNITNPFDTSDISEEMLEALRTAAKNAEYVEGNSADLWDKRNISPDQWIKGLEEDIADGTFYTWTRIPDFVTDTLKAHGYDGIFDIGGKGGGIGHTVAIPFYSEQIKNVDNLNPTENPDIRYSLSKENDIAPIKSGNVPLKDLAYQSTVSKTEQVQKDILPIKEGVAKNATTIPEEFAPMTEAEFNELNDNQDRLNSFTDNDVPEQKEAPYYEDNDVIHLPQKRIDDIAKTVYDFVFPKKGEKKVLKDVIQRYATSEIPDKYALFDEIKKVYGVKENSFKSPNISEARKHLAKMRLRITDDIKAEYPEYVDFMRHHRGRLLFANDGAKVDEAYQELSDLYPDLFPTDIWNAADQFARIVEVSETDIEITETLELLDEDIQQAVDIIAEEVTKYTEAQMQRRAERENRAFFKMLPKYWEKLMPPIAEDGIGNTASTKAIAPVKSVKKQGEMQDEKIAEILMKEPKVDKKKGLKRDWERFTSNFVDKATPIETIALKTGNRELDGKYNTIRYADTKAQTLIGKGADGVKSLNDIFGQIQSEADLEKFYNYLYHKHNVDRMSLESRELPNLERLTEEMRTLKLDKLEEKQLYAISREKITDDTTEKRAHIIETVREYLKSIGVKNKPVYGDSVTAQISQEIVEKYEFENPDFVQVAEDIYNYNRHLRSELVDGGVISQETADLFEELYPHYVPIRRLNHKGMSVNVPLDTRKTGINAPIKRAQGGNSDILPLAQTMAQRTLQTYKAVAKNRFGVELKNTLGTTVEKAETDIDEIIEGVDTHEELLQKGKNGANPTFTVFENGEKVTFEITEAIYDALKPTSEALSKTYNVLSKPTGLFKKLVTEYNPAFMLTNPIKDTQDVLLNSQHPLQTYKNYPKAIAEMFSKGKWYSEYMKNGGSDDSYFDNETNTFIEEEKSGIKKAVGFPLEKISEANNFLERLPRLAEYIASREMGRSEDVAMLDSARVTTNFRAGGDVTKFFNRNGVTFLNPSVQGAVQQVRNIREAKANGFKGWGLLATKVMLAGLPGMLLNGLLWDDDEDYEELSDYVKQNYYIVWKNEDGKFIRVPKGRALAVIQNAFTQVQNALTGNDEIDIGSFLELVANNIAPNNPLENNILAPIMQVKNNKTWYGEDLVPSRLQDLPAKEQFDESTDKISRWLGDKLNISPVKINYLLNQYSGGVGDMLLPMLTPEAESGKDSVLSNFTAPIRDKFTTDSVMNNQNVSNFYKISDELKVNANSSEATEEDKLKSKYFNAIRSEMSELYKEKREIQNSEYLNDSEKYNRVREIQMEINALSEEALNSYNSVEVDGKFAAIGDKQYRLNNDNEWQKISDEEIEKQNEVIGILGITASQYWNNKKEYDMKAFYPEKYKVLQEQGISVEDYKENYEEMAHIYTDDYSWASDNPEKYTLSKAVTDDVSVYKQYTSDLYNIKADKDSNGKSISGSRKEKVHDYIFDLDIEDGAKYILFKSEYNADDTYNYEIIDYLNEREDISYSDMETILKELGFEVDSQGNISW